MTIPNELSHSQWILYLDRIKPAANTRAPNVPVKVKISEVIQRGCLLARAINAFLSTLFSNDVCILFACSMSCLLKVQTIVGTIFMRQMYCKLDVIQKRKIMFNNRKPENDILSSRPIKNMIHFDKKMYHCRLCNWM